MIFESVNDNVMTAELSAEEMRKYSVTYDSLENGNPLAETAVKAVLSRARETFGRLPHGGTRVTAEVLPTGDGGCFFIFTFRDSRKRYRVKKTAHLPLLEAESIDDILDFASAVGRIKEKRRKMKLFLLGGKYFLLPEYPPVPPRIMSEYGEVRYMGSLDISRLSEHGEYLGKV